ncbi:DUF4386 family protein [Arthrobacter sp. Z4-13]
MPLGYPAIKSRLFPKTLGIVLMVATASYLTAVVLAFLLPALAMQIFINLNIVHCTAEIWMVFYLLLVGVRTPRTTNHVPPQAAPLPA